MPADEGTLSVVREWVVKAENDLRAGAYLLRMRKNCPTDAVCFHAQQCVEKYLKAVLVLDGIDFPRTHDLGELAALLPSRIRLHMTVQEQQRLTTYAALARYPGGYEPIPVAEAREAVKTARRIREEIRQQLPPGARGGAR